MINNGGYCSIRNTQTNYFSKDFSVDSDSSLFLPNLKDLANTYKINYQLIEGVNNLKKKIQKL